MSLETTLYTALKTLVQGNRVYRDVAPPTVTELPRITFQVVGGDSINFMDAATIPSIRNARVQISVWHNRRDDVDDLARQVEDAMRAYTALHTTVLGGFVTVYETETKLFGTMQDFSCWV